MGATPVKDYIAILWCEWDYGQDEVAFSDSDKAKAWFNKALTAIEDEDWRTYLGFEDAKEDNPFDALFEAGFVGINILPVDPE